MTRILKTFYDLRQWGVIFLASLLAALAFEFFLIPNAIVLGGAAGIATILDLVTPDQLYFSVGLWIVAINIPIIIYFFVTLSRRYATKALGYVLITSAILFLLRVFDVADFLGLAADAVDNRVIYTLIGGALAGLATPLMISVNSSTGGSDIVGLVMQKKQKKSSSDSMRIVLLTDVCVVFVSSIVYYCFTAQDIDLAVRMFVYSIAALFVREIVQETVYKGFSSAMQLNITTSKPEEIAVALRTELKHGVTILRAVGGYSQEEKAMIVCVIQKRQLTHARRIISKFDSAAFAYVENVKEVIGLGFSNKEVEIEKETVEVESKSRKKSSRTKVD